MAFWILGPVLLSLMSVNQAKQPNKQVHKVCHNYVTRMFIKYVTIMSQVCQITVTMLYYKNKHQFSRFRCWRSILVPLYCAVGCFISQRVGVANNAGSHRPANPVLPISAGKASSNIKLQAEGQKRIENNYTMALIRLQDCRINIKRKIVNSGCKS